MRRRPYCWSGTPAADQAAARGVPRALSPGRVLPPRVLHRHALQAKLLERDASLAASQAALLEAREALAQLQRLVQRGPPAQQLQQGGMGAQGSPRGARVRRRGDWRGEEEGEGTMPSGGDSGGSVFGV